MKRKVQMFVIFCFAASLITLGGVSCAKKEVKVETPVVDNSAAEAAKKR